MVLVVPDDGKCPGAIRCLECDRVDPLQLPWIAARLASELRLQSRSAVARAFSSPHLMPHVRGRHRFASGAVRREIWRPLSIYFKESSWRSRGVAVRLTASLTSFRSRLSSGCFSSHSSMHEEIVAHPLRR
jgi:hypothetical protein